MLILDDKLQIKHWCSQTKISKKTKLLKVISKKGWGADHKVMLLLYKALLRSKWDYSCVACSLAHKSYLKKKLQPIQTKALRLCLGAFHTSPTQSICRSQLPPHYICNEKSYHKQKKYLVYQAQYTYFYTNKPTAIISFGFCIKEASTQGYENPKNIVQLTLTHTPPWMTS